jgi:hypothetical protein
MPDIVLDYHRLKTPIDHPDKSVTATKLNLDYIILNPVTADPSPLQKGMIWFRGDLGQLRYTPDGSTIYVIDPAPVVDKSWSDTTGHYFNSTLGTSTYWNALPVIQLDQPATGHKRSFEATQTGYDYIHGWLLKRNAMLSTRLDIVARVGAYHGYDAMRANLALAIIDDNNLDKISRNNSYPWLWMEWSMSSLGYSNGSYGKPLSGYIVFTDPPSYSFSPANPSRLYYNLITSIPNKRWHLLYGYEDVWAADWDQWASLQRGIANTYFRYRVATKPPEPEILLDLSKDVTDAEAYIAKWDGEVRLWVKRGERGLIVPLGKNVIIASKGKTTRSVSINLFEKILRSGREPERICNYIEIIINTDRQDLHKINNTWRLAVLDYGDGYMDIVLGDMKWDGDKYGYYIHGFS